MHGTDRRTSVRDERKERTGAKDVKAPETKARVQHKGPDTPSDDPDGGLVDTVVDTVDDVL